MDDQASQRLVRLGVFGAAQGVRGEVRIKSFTEDPKSIGAYGALTDAKGARRFAIETLRALKDDMVVARIAGVTTREAAQALTGVELYARRSQLPPPELDEFYYDDLVGLSAVTPWARSSGASPRSSITAPATFSRSRQRAAARRCCCLSHETSPSRSTSPPAAS